MCLILLAVDSHPQYPLVVAANRDEYYARPTRPLQRWPDAPQLWAGQDLTAGGTWLGLTGSGRFAAVTNAREIAPPADPRSRGSLPLDFLLGNDTPEDYARRIADEGAHYAGFNLLVGDHTGLYYCSNGEQSARGPRRLGPGVYGVANASLDTPWPKVESGKADLRSLLMNERLAPQSLLDLIKTPADTAMPLAGLSMEATTEYLQATRFISSNTYGTRASTALLLGRDGDVVLWEQNFSSGGKPELLSQFHWQIEKHRPPESRT